MFSIFRYLVYSFMISVVLTAISFYLLLVYLNHEYDEAKNLNQGEEFNRIQSVNDVDMILHFVNLKVGKPVVVQTGDQGIVFDVGHRQDTSALRWYLKDHGISTITHIFLSNPLPENMGGLQELASQFKSAKVYIPEITEHEYPIPKEVAYQTIKQGDEIILSKEKNISVEMLAPFAPPFGNAKNDTLISLLKYGDLQVLLTSDMGEKAEAKLLSHYPDLQVEILTVPDRQSGVVHSEPFIKKINPQTAIMVGVPCEGCNEVVEDADDRFSMEWSDFFYVPIGKNLMIYFDEGTYTTPKEKFS